MTDIAGDPDIVLTTADLLYQIHVPAREPFSLPLTVTALMRRQINAVDELDAAGVYSRAFAAGNDAWVVQAKPAPGGFDLKVYGTRATSAAAWAALLGKMLGADRDLRGFYAVAATIPGLDALAAQVRGLKPPRYPTLWEALANAIVFQQISIDAAMSIMVRVVLRIGYGVQFGDVLRFPFPTPQRMLDAGYDELRAARCTDSKARALLTAAEVIVSGELDLAVLETLPNEEVVARLVRLRGVGPWTAAKVLLRGMGRLDVFPPADSGAARGLRDLFGWTHPDISLDTAAVLAALGPYRGMLYYHLLLQKLAQRGQLPVDGGQ